MAQYDVHPASMDTNGLAFAVGAIIQPSASCSEPAGVRLSRELRQDARVQRIVVDAMGGDHAPDEIVQGAAEASLALPSAEIILVGDAAVLGRLLPRMRHDGARVRVHHAPQYVEMDEKPAEALAAKPESSIAVAVDLVARGEGDAVVSAGNTGASVLACARRWQLLAGRAARGARGRVPDRAPPRREGRSVLADPRCRRDDRRDRRRPRRVRA